MARGVSGLRKSAARQQQTEFENERELADQADRRAYQQALTANQRQQNESLNQQRMALQMEKQRAEQEKARAYHDRLAALGRRGIMDPAVARDDVLFRGVMAPPTPTPRNIDPLSPEGIAARRQVAGFERQPSEGPIPVQMTDAEGNVSFVNPRTGQVVARPPEGMHGGTRTTTEGERKGAALLHQARNAYDAIEAYQPSLQAQQLARVPIVGNIMAGRADPAGQAAQQAGYQFADAYMRFVSGAAVPEQEVRRYAATFLPQPGDQPPVVARKKAARKAILEALEIGAGRAAGPQPQTRAVRRPLASIVGSIPE